MSSSNGEVNKSIKLTAKTNKIELTIGILELKIPGNSFRRKGNCATDGAVGANLQPPSARPLMAQPASESRAGRPWCKLAEFQDIILEGVITMGCSTHVEG